jgi:hypothetical protein
MEENGSHMLHVWTKINAEQLLGNGLDGPWFESRLGREIFFPSKTSRLTLVTTQSPIQ